MEACMEAFVENCNDVMEKAVQKPHIELQDVRHFDIKITIEIIDLEKGTRKIKEMEQIIRTLQAETTALNDDDFEMKTTRKQVTQLVEIFAEAGGTLVQICPGSIVFTVRCYAKEDLQKLWKSYKNETLENRLKINLINESIGKRVYKKLGINVTIDEKAYKKGLKFFPKEKTLVTTPSLPSEESSERPAHKPSLSQYVIHSRQSISNADKEIQKLKEEIRERCDQLGKMYATREEVTSNINRNLEKFAVKITFDVSARTVKAPPVKRKTKKLDRGESDVVPPVENKAKKIKVESDAAPQVENKAKTIKVEQDVVPPVENKAKKIKVESEVVAVPALVARRQELQPPSTFTSAAKPTFSWFEEKKSTTRSPLTPTRQSGFLKHRDQMKTKADGRRQSTVMRAKCSNGSSKTSVAAAFQSGISSTFWSADSSPETPRSVSPSFPQRGNIYKYI